MSDPDFSASHWGMFNAAHWSDCAVNNAPALPAGPCNCGGYNQANALTSLPQTIQHAQQAAHKWD